MPLATFPANPVSLQSGILPSKHHLMDSRSHWKRQATQSHLTSLMPLPCRVSWRAASQPAWGQLCTASAPSQGPWQPPGRVQPVDLHGFSQGHLQCCTDQISACARLRAAAADCVCGQPLCGTCVIEDQAGSPRAIGSSTCAPDYRAGQAERLLETRTPIWPVPVSRSSGKRRAMRPGRTKRQNPYFDSPNAASFV